MGAAAPAVMIAISAFSGAMAYMSQRSAARDQERIARENARHQEMAAEMNARRTLRETEEEARRMEKQQSEQEASARARAASSGVQMTGSINEYLEGMMSENAAQRDWLRKSGQSRASEYLWAGESRADITRMEGRTIADATRRKGYSALVSSAGNIYGYGKGTYW